MRTIRFGVVGCGLMGREFASAAGRWMHLLDLPFRPEIVAVADPVASARDWFTRNVPSVTQSVATPEELLSNPEVEAVYAAVPHNLHEQIYLQILQSGRHLMAEKPFGIDLPAATNIIEEVRKRPEQLVRCSSEYPFFPGPQRIVKLFEQSFFGEIMEVHAGFLHSSDLDPMKPINWKRQVATNGEYGCMGDLGLHVLHLPLRFGWVPRRIQGLLSKIIKERPDGKGGMAACETWDNATLACLTDQGFPMILETKRIAPGETNTWFIKIRGTKGSAEFSTKHPKTLRTLQFPQAWLEEDLGSASAYPGITGHIFEFGFSDSILQMWAAFCDELVNRENMIGPFRCATPEEAFKSHQVFTAAIASWETFSE